MKLFRRGAVGAVVGCASLALVVGLHVCSAKDSNGGAAPKAQATDFGVLSTTQRADIFLYNNSDDKATVTFSNVGNSPNVVTVNASQVPAKKSLRNGLFTSGPQLFTSDDPYKSKPVGKIRRNSTYAKLGRNADTKMWIDYSDANGKGLTKQFKFRKVCGDELSNIIAMVQVGNDGQAICTEAEVRQLDQAFGIRNPYDPAGLSVRKRVNNTVGTEWVKDGGKDGTTKLIVALVSGDNFSDSGYTNERDECDEKYSNGGEIVYVCAGEGSETWNQNFKYLLSTLAHEYQHICHCNQRYCHDGRMDGDDEGSMVDEGTSVLIEELTGLGMELFANGRREPGIEEHARYWQAFLKNSWVYRFGDFWDEEDKKLGGDDHGSYGKGVAIMRYIYDTYGVAAVTRVAKGVDISGRPFNDQDDVGIELATGYDFEQTAMGMLIACAGYQSAPKGMAYTGMRFGDYWVTDDDEDDDGNTVTEHITLSPLSSMKRVRVNELSNTKFSLAGHSGGYIRVVGDGRTPLVLKHSALGEDIAGSVIVNDNQRFDADRSIRL